MKGKHRRNRKKKSPPSPPRPAAAAGGPGRPDGPHGHHHEADASTLDHVPGLVRQLVLPLRRGLPVRVGVPVPSPRAVRHRRRGEAGEEDAGAGPAFVPCGGAPGADDAGPHAGVGEGEVQFALRVSGMTCGGCARPSPSAIRRSSPDGVRDVAVDVGERHGAGRGVREVVPRGRRPGRRGGGAGRGGGGGGVRGGAGRDVARGGTGGRGGTGKITAAR